MDAAAAERSLPSDLEIEKGVGVKLCRCSGEREGRREEEGVTGRA